MRSQTLDGAVLRLDLDGISLCATQNGVSGPAMKKQTLREVA